MAYMNFEGPGFSMVAPTDWLITSSPEYQAIFLGPENTAELRPNLLVAIRPHDPNTSAAMVAEKAKETQSKEYPNYHILGEIDYSETGGSGFRREYSWLNDENKQEVYQIQVFFPLNNALFTLTATYFAIDEPSIAETLSQMVDSFRFSVRNVS